MTSPVWHLRDEALEKSIRYCDTPLGHGLTTMSPAATTCPACIAAYETRPQPVTTADLVRVLRVMQSLARRGARVGGSPDPLMKTIVELIARHERPRKAKPVEPAEPKCGKCGRPVDPDDDCQRCYPR